MRSIIISAFKLRTYRVLAIGNTVSMLGVWIQKVAAGWLAWDISHSTVWLGLVTAADLIPAVLFSSFFGVMADNHDKVRLLRIAQVIAILEALLVSALVFAQLMTVEILFVLTLVLGVANSVDQPSRLSLLREVLPADYIPAAVAFNSLSFNIARFVGPMLAGLTIALGSIGFTFLLSAVMLGWFLAGLLTLPVAAPSAKRPKASLLGDMAEGFAHVLRNRILAQTMVIVILFGCTVGGINQMLPALAAKVFSRGVEGFLQLTVAAALGAVAAGMVVFLLPERRSVSFGQPACFALASLALAGLAVTDHYLLGAGCLFLATFASTQSAIQAQSALNRVSPSNALGRVMGIYGAVVRGAPALGGVVIGSFASFVPFAPILIACAALMGLFYLWLLREKGRSASPSRFSD
ncbi:MFS transporter [Martelella mediterranea]|uniref:MFS transporter n=1 Tax=Martelella mediterranea TaxID=293089 RepID=UPI001E566206|nr:MFS transporter [Martelella mediterranea]MCD1633349.1 MFS transporter [Martelella mediterranea]